MWRGTQCLSAGATGGFTVLHTERQGKALRLSYEGKEAIITILGKGCLAGQILRFATATAMTDCTLDRIEKSLMEEILHEHHDISELFVNHLLLRNFRYEADLVDHLFNSSETRLARILL